MRPMLLAHLDDLLDSGETVWNEYSIYRALVESWLLREQRKSGSSDPDYAQKLKNACRYAAVKMHTSGRRYFTRIETDLLNRLASAGDREKAVDLGGRSLLNKDSDGNFRFSHYSVQEFLVVEHLIVNQQVGLDEEGIRTTDFMNTLGIAWLLQASTEMRRNRKLRFLMFRGAVMPKADLSHTNLSRVDLFGANLVGANLSFSDLSNSDLTDCNLNGANLSGANLAESKLIGANLEYSNLSGAILRGAKLLGASLLGADLSKADIAYSAYDESTRWSTAVSPQALGAKLVKPPKASDPLVDSSSIHLGVDDDA
jgi:uncharacterized protein YjbI with pentapeptide repeats